MLFDARLESSVTPPVRVTSDDVFGGKSAPSSGGAKAVPPLFSLSDILLSVLRPKFTIKSDFGSKTVAPYGEPFPWQIGFALMLLGIAYIGHLSYLAIRKAVR